MSGRSTSAKGPSRIEGYAIVSEDGMLADASGVMPGTLKFEADQKFFADSLDTAAAVAHGAHSHEQQPHSPGRPRLTLTRRVTSLALDSKNPKGLLWNPAGASLDAAWAALNLDGGTLGIVGGTQVFGLFLDRYDAFYLSRAQGVRLPGGRPVFPGVPAQTPEQIMTRHGLNPGPVQTLDAAKNLTMTTWSR
ncbi:MAG: dihydrofolate reductase [Pseudolabrys sp.]